MVDAGALAMVSTPTTASSVRSATTVACGGRVPQRFLLGCVGAWSLYLVQILIAKKGAFSPVIQPTSPMPGRVIEAMGE